MKRYQIPVLRFVLGTFVAVIPLVAVSCSSSSEADDRGKYPLWKVEGKQNTVWLLGSVHALPESAHPFPEAFDEAYRSSQNLVFEIDMSSMAMMQVIGLFTQAMLPAGQTLEDVLEPETMELLRPRLGKLLDGISGQLGDMSGMMPEGSAEMPLELDPEMMEGMLMRMQPWFIGFLIQSGEATREDYRPEYGVDLHYMTKAREDGKDVSGLESFDDQISVFRRLAGDDPDSYLMAILQQSDTVMTDIDAVVEAWKRGDLEELERLVSGELKKDPEVNRLLLTDRNENWIPHIERFLRDSENYLVVVGAGHLIGDNSVVELLRERGYRVVRQ